MAPTPRLCGAALAAGLVTAGAWAQGTTAIPPASPPGITTEQLPPPPGVPGQPLAAPPGTPPPGTPATGTPPPGTATPGTAEPGTPEPGTPPPGPPAPSTPPPGTPAPNTPATGTPAPGTPPAAPAPEFAAPGAPASSQPAAAPDATAPPGAAPTPPAEGTYPPAPPVPINWLPQGTAVLQVLDKVDAQSVTLAVKVGSSVQSGPLTIGVRACDVSAPDQAQDATAFLDITDSHADAPSFHGWMLQSNPSVSMLQHPIYDVRVLGCRP